MNLIAPIMLPKAIPVAPPIFDFLSASEAAKARVACNKVGRIIEGTRRVSAALFDIDRTLLREPSGLLSGRMAGAMTAFYRAGIPVGIYSMRPDSGIKLFPRQNRPITSMVAICEGGWRLTYGNEFIVNGLRELTDGLESIRLDVREERSYVDTRNIMKVPVLERFDEDGEPIEIGVVKLAPFLGALLIDDKNYAGAYEMILRALMANGEMDSEIYSRVAMSLSHFWHVGESKTRMGFTHEQYQFLARLFGV